MPSTAAVNSDVAGDFRLKDLVILAQALQLPLRPLFFHSFFADLRAGFSTKAVCSQPHGYGDFVPQFCIAAHADAVWAQALCDMVALGVVSFLVAPIVGQLSDRLGRFPLLLAVMVLGTVPPVLMALHEAMNISLYFYFPFLALQGDGIMFTLVAAIVSDLVSAKNRSAMLALNMAVGSVSSTVGPLVAGQISARLAVWLSAGGVGLSCLLFVVFWFETISPSTQSQARERQRMQGISILAPLQCFRLLSKNKLFVQLTVVGALASLTQAGINSVLPQLLQVKLDISKHDLGLLFTAAGGVGFVTQVVLVRVMTCHLGECRILAFSSVMRLLELLVFCFGGTKKMMYLGIVFGGLANLVSLSASGILSRHTAADEQGIAQGALSGVICLASGPAPPVFAFLFTLFSKRDSSVPFFPGAPYILGAALMLVGIVVALCIDRKVAEPQKEAWRIEPREAIHVEEVATFREEPHSSCSIPRSQACPVTSGPDSFRSICLDDDVDHSLTLTDPDDWVDVELGLGVPTPRSQAWQVTSRADSFRSICLDDDDGHSLALMDPDEWADVELGLEASSPRQSPREGRTTWVPKLNLSAVLPWRAAE